MSQVRVNRPSRYRYKLALLPSQLVSLRGVAPSAGETSGVTPWPDRSCGGSARPLAVHTCDYAFRACSALFIASVTVARSYGIFARAAASLIFSFHSGPSSSGY